MSLSGWILMLGSWGVVSVLSGVLIYLTLRVSRSHDESEEGKAAEAHEA